MKLRQDIHSNFDIILTLTEEFRPSQRSVDTESILDFSEILTVSFFNAVPLPKIIIHILKLILSTQKFPLIFYRSEAYSLASGEEHKLRDAICTQRSQESAEFKKISLIFVVPSIMLYSSEISPTRCNNCVFILRNGFTLHVSGDNLTHYQEYICCIWPQVSRLT